MTQDGVGCGQVKIEVRRHEIQQILAPRKGRLGSTEFQHDDTVLAAVDLLGGNAFHEGECFGDALLQLVEGGLGVGIAGDLHPGQPRDTPLNRVGGDVDLAGERQHIGREAVADQHGRIDLARLGRRRRLVQNGRQIGQHAREDRNAGLVHGQGHGDGFRSRGRLHAPPSACVVAP